MNVQEALAALKANPPHEYSPLPWHNDAKLGAIYCASGFEICGRRGYEKDRVHIAAVVNAAPILAAEVERLQGLLAAAKEAVDVWPAPAHSFYCGYWRGPDGYDSRLCDCDVEQRRGDRAHARRAVGLEG